MPRTVPPLPRTADARTPGAPDTTLADLGAGEMAYVTRIASASLRDLLADLGLAEGAAVEVRRTGRWWIVDTARGRVPLERAVAGGVRVARSAAA